MTIHFTAEDKNGLLFDTLYGSDCTNSQAENIKRFLYQLQSYFDVYMTISRFSTKEGKH